MLTLKSAYVILNMYLRKAKALRQERNDLKMAFVKTDMEKERLRQLTSIIDNEELAIYDISIKLKNINLWLEYIGQVHNQTMLERYEQHIGKNGKIRKILEDIGLDNIEKIELKCLYNQKHRNTDLLDKKEMDLLSKRKVETLLMKKKRVFVTNISEKVGTTIKYYIQALTKELQKN